ncbi:MAG TPA: outer membrane beta-barrel protein [Chthoniobacterales bacterium]|nr:outer membrane beta-barrel protein [Chthoniobacterales bacterium]
MSASLLSRVCTFSRPRIGWALLLPLLLVAGMVRAQEAVRPSLAGEAAAEARRQTLDRIPYNLLVGPVRFRFSATAGLEYNDNINISEINEQEDFIFRPMINLNTLWPVTQLNTLRFDLGLSYAFYFDHSEYNTDGLLLAPGSALSFDLFVGDFRINFHDRFSLEQDPIDEPQLNDVADYGRFQNTAGVSVLWDLNKAVATFGYEHYTFIATNDEFDYLDRNAEMLTASLSVAATSTTGVGLEGAFVFNNYDRDILNDSETLSGGVFVETQLSNYIKLRVAGGYQRISFDNDFVRLEGFPDGGFVLLPDDSELDDFYLNALISHRINAAITQRLSLGHESQLGVNSNYIKLNYIRHTATWNIINRTLLSTEFFYEDAEDSGGFIDEHLHRYGGALTLGYQLTRHVTLGARYQYTQKDSDVPLRDYKQNRVSIDGTYSF